MTFPNLMPKSFLAEIEEANKAAYGKQYKGGPGPYGASYSNGCWYPGSGFRHMVQSENKFKWTLNQRADLGVINPSLKHSVASGGGDVITAGHGWYDRKSKILTIDNDTGHYQTSEKSLLLSKKAWSSIGYEVKFKARVDYMALFQ